MSSGPNSGSHGTTHTNHWASGSPYAMSTTTSPGLAGSLPLPESHIVFLSGFDNDTTLLQTRTNVVKASYGHGLTDHNLQTLTSTFRLRFDSRPRKRLQLSQVSVTLEVFGIS
ncbi:hypothetical protein F4860DRAFT_510207 [Xylaria cubensis]|nr:hypothetical protein F4860DRAFT_510207 [Xylaria cubensis]